MPQDKFLIAPINSGIQQDVKPWLIMDDAFETLQNVYSFRGRIRKRPGGRLMGEQPYQSRLRIKIGTTSAGGDLNVAVPGSKFLVGQQFTIGDQILTVINLGVPAALLDTAGSVIATFNTTTGVFDIVGSPNVNTDVYYYPSQPVMGLSPYEQDSSGINNEPFYAFDTQFGYKFSAGGWERTGTAAPLLLHGNDLDFVWTSSWQSIAVGLTAFFISNFHVTNPNGAGTANDDSIWQTADGSTWAKFNPRFKPNGGLPTSGPFLVTALCMLPFQDRFLVFNTIENDGTVAPGVNRHFPQRCRFSANLSPFQVNAWYEYGNVDSADNTFVGGGFTDCPTDEEIVSVEYLRNHLIVYFERSTWQLVYTQQGITTFVWEKLNTELGAQSTFSIVPFDKVVLGIGGTGIHACNGQNVERTDTKIPDQVFNFSAGDRGVERTAGIRDYFVEMVYWSFREVGTDLTYPNKILAYNYRNGSWALFDDCITSFGYYNQQVASTWEHTHLTWEQANMPWNSGTINAGFSQVIAGNQQGYTFVVDAGVSRNAPVLQITGIADNPGIGYDLHIVNHSISEGEYIVIEDAQGINPLINGESFNVVLVNDADNITVFNPAFVGVTSAGYTGGGQATRLSQINILSKQYNPYIDKLSNFSINKIDFAVQKTSVGAIEVDYSTSSSYYSTVGNSVISPTAQGTNTLETFPYPLYPFEKLQTRLWHTIYFDTQGECIQLNLHFSADQLFIPEVAWEDFQLEAIALYVQPTGRVE